MTQEFKGVFCNGSFLYFFNLQGNKEGWAPPSHLKWIMITLANAKLMIIGFDYVDLFYASYCHKHEMFHFY